MNKCKVIAITNQKGGVGKTTTTVNLGVGLVNQGRRVLLVDADPQGSLTVSLGIRNPDELETSLSTIMKAVIDDTKLPNGIVKNTEGVDLVPSNIELAGIPSSIPYEKTEDYVLKALEYYHRHLERKNDLDR